MTNDDSHETERRTSSVFEGFDEPEITDDVLSDVFDRLCAAVKEEQVYFAKERGFMVWKDGEGELVGIVLRCYRRRALRLCSRSLENESIPGWLLPPGCTIGTQVVPDNRRFPNLYGFELTFVLEDVPEVVRNFIAFTESAFNHPENPELIWKWPLLASDRDFPWFARSVTAANRKV
jgi:hypothetical protein